MTKILKTDEDNQTIETDLIENGCWIYLEDPNSSEIELISEKTGLDEGFIRAALDKEESSRLEVEGEQMLMLLDIPVMELENTSARYSTIPLGIVLNDNFIVTVCLQNNNIIDDFLEQKIKTFYTYKKSRFILQILLRIDKYYLNFLKQIDKNSKIIETNLHRSMKNKELIELLALEKSLVFFSTSLKSNQSTLEKMLKLKMIKKYPEDEELLEDVIIENSQAIEMASIYSNILSGTMDAFASIINNNLNIVMKILTSITIVMAIPTIFGSLFGMNVPVPLGNHQFGFIIIMGITIAISIVVLFVLAKKKMF